MWLLCALPKLSVQCTKVSSCLALNVNTCETFLDLFKQYFMHIIILVLQDRSQCPLFKPFYRADLSQHTHHYSCEYWWEYVCESVCVFCIRSSRITSWFWSPRDTRDIPLLAETMLFLPFWHVSSLNAKNIPFRKTLVKHDGFYWICRGKKNQEYL